MKLMSEEVKKDLQEEPDTEEQGAEGQDKADTEDTAQEDLQEQKTEGTEEKEQTPEPIAGNGEEGKESRKAARKKLKADKKQDALKQKIDELEDRVKRQMAEFENFRKRTEREKTAMFETGARSVIEKILPVVDNFERGLATVPQEEKNTPFAEGMEMIYKQLLTELEKMEVKPIQAVGEEFNPEYHNAVMQVESEEYDSGVVAQELQKGYMYRDTVIRHSMVAVVS